MSQYNLYGIRLRSRWPLPYPSSISGDADIELSDDDGSSVAYEAGRAVSVVTRAGYLYGRLPDGSTYLRWPDFFEFLVSSDGRRVTGRPLGEVAYEAFQTYLFGQVMSFAMLKAGIEPLHATVVVVHGQAIGFLGDCGYGKSSLAATFVQAGDRLLTDDLLVVKDVGPELLACPGPPRIKLFPEIATALLGEGVAGVPMNPVTPKLVIPLGADQCAQAPASLRRLYVLSAPGEDRVRRISLKPLSRRQTFLELLKNTFNGIVVEPQRLRRQFDQASRVSGMVKARTLRYPRTLGCLPAVRDAVLADLTP